MPILSQHSMELISRSPVQTRRAGMRLGALLKPGDVIGLVGDLGAGKTTLVQGLAAGWGSLDPVSSPTFVLVNVYRGAFDQRLYHLDAYRLDSQAEAADLDLDALLESGPLVVEWADRIAGVLPAERLWLHMNYVAEDQRDLVFEAYGRRYQDMLAVFRKKVFGNA